MKIEKIQLFTCKMPLKIPFQHASSGLITELEGVFVKLCTDENVCGYGEVRGNCSYFTGDTTGSVLATIRECIAPKLKGKDPLCINELHQVIESSVISNSAAKAACDIAVFDLAGKIQNQPVHHLLGGKINSYLQSEENIPFMSAFEAEILAKKIIAEGSRFIKVRVGAKNFAYDLERISAVWNVIKESGLSNEILFSVDANQAWGVRDAIIRINQLAEFGVTIVEQPIQFNSIIRLKQLKENCKIKLFGDESVSTVNDFVRFCEMGVLDGIHIKLIKCGGISNAIRLMHLAEAYEIEYMIGGMDEGMMAVAAAVHCAAVANTNLFEVHGHLRILEDPSSGLKCNGSIVQVPDAPGLGIIIDEAKLDKVLEL